MSRIERINEQMKGELANLISREIPLDSGLITVSFVETSPDMRSAKVGISVIPNNVTGTALKKVRGLSAFFNREIKKKLKIKMIPKFRFSMDDRERFADEIEKIILDKDF